MTSIPLSSVVAFLRPRGALGVLEGAPCFSSPASHLNPYIGAFQAVDLEDPVFLKLGSLYLGDGEICPAAEGWAARVLGLARNIEPKECRLWTDRFGREVHIGRLWMEESDFRWDWWRTETEVSETHDQVVFPGAPPATPAERLSAVLRYEMERAR